MQVHWLEQTELDLPVEDDWLGPSERLRLNSLHIRKRRADWRLGRWTAKRAVASYLKWSADPQTFARIQIQPAPSGAPKVVLDNATTPLRISITHRSGTSMCAVAASGADLGCDLELIEPHSEAFVADYFTLEEQALISCVSSEERSRILALLWSGKESVLKALGEGFRLDTRFVVVSLNDEYFDFGSWNRMQARCGDGRVFQGWWRQTGCMMKAVMIDPPSCSPLCLQIHPYRCEAKSVRMAGD